MSASHSSNELKITKVTDNYYDEILELSGSELDEFPTPTEERSVEVTAEVEGGESMAPAGRGDTPPSAGLSDSDEDYDDDNLEDEDDDQQLQQPHTQLQQQKQRSGISFNDDDEDDEDDEDNPMPTHPPTRPSAAPAGRGTLSNAPMSTSLGSGGLLNDNDDRDSDGSFARMDVGRDGEFEDDGDGHEGSGKRGGFGGLLRTGESSYKDLSMSEELADLFQYIGRYKPTEMELETELKPFYPDYVPAIGDIDAFIKIPRPDGHPTPLGLSVLDEPSIPQSDPTVLDLQLRSLSKSTTSSLTPLTVHSLPHHDVVNTPRLIDGWIRNIKELHAGRDAAVAAAGGVPGGVKYSKRMPDVEELMQVWPPEVEEGLAELTLPPATLDLPLATYAQLLALILDIPVASPTPISQAQQQAAKKQPSKTQTIEALHVMFSLYAEFSHSAHFKNVEVDAGGGGASVGGTGGMVK
ncbi:intraflagellar transport complex B protein 46 C terminal-domain-containing protein [Fimicolochytrium jonesii]|uniref:intraflagellar transport complex B protein 46 C terminal-domain-containing protein n=1 Tax=Fimicolochytrium jonesii TaxID=1396493 RepID=UPI0022FF269F|nr:intraflagellar transport complex B protein 46 C terminal-domain-containing protein [Fimicolochytrium jonesii]KAI8820200.1 intraflagellar transport complex B protein 46 C terminal-domain-containing protein [Fimicolochytrium jonesii]